ncbi:MAG TPA: nickel pincer cofactor biosynthesis protein LarC [Candidatus Aquicultor sp.]|jgi:hypothetical protein
MKVAYIDCFAGVSGDMFAGALLDAGLPIGVLEKELAKLPVGDYEISAKKVLKQHISATKFTVTVGEQHIVRTWRNVRELIEASSLDYAIKVDSLAVFARIANAEAKVHGKPVEQVHFHEVGAVDSIVDIVAGVVGVHHLGIEKLYSSPVATGTGMVKTEHGTLPVPAPATLEILEGAPIYGGGITAELTTPTGAALLMHFATFVEDIPQNKLEATGYGAGSSTLEIPNVVRILVGEEERVAEQDVVLLETNIDDAPAEVLGYTMQALFELGALDVWFIPIEMKKSRPAVMLSALTPMGIEEQAIDVIFAETSTLGVRVRRQSRRIAEREIISVDTPFGKVRAKVGTYKGKIIAVSPEYEDVSKLALATGRPFKDIFDAARQAASSIRNR